jgi:uncharacterized membrane protein (UPF0182 family)
MGNKLAYADTYEQALAQLIAAVGGSAPAIPSVDLTQPAANTTASTQSTAPAPAAQPSAQAIETLKAIRSHLQRYRELSSQGKWAEAGKELDEIQGLVQK